MGWIWLLFLAFSLLSNILEKLMKEQNPSRPVKPSDEQGRPLPPGKPFSFPPILTGEWAEEKGPAETLPKAKPEVGPLPVEKRAPVTAMDVGQEQEEPGPGEEDWFYDQQEEWDGKDFGVASSIQAGAGEEEEDPGGWVLDAPLFYNAFVLAHVLPRPDWRTVPWLRRP